MIDRTKSLCDFTDEELKALGEEIIARLKDSDSSVIETAHARKELEVIFPHIEGSKECH